ncbi:MAG: hypothetical protein H5T65_12220 [Chloroflexi bacterium]|nr:hypothetical protein [Chloroflexota bacterium]
MRRQRPYEPTALDMDDRERFRRTLLLILVGFILLLYLLGALSLWARRRFLHTPPAPSAVVRVETACPNACKFVLT